MILTVNDDVCRKMIFNIIMSFLYFLNLDCSLLQHNDSVVHQVAVRVVAMT